MVRCPGQNLRFWKLGDIFDAECPHCGTTVEFWKDEPSVKCPRCRRVIADHGKGKVGDAIESKILWDAEWLARIGDHSVALDALKAKGPVLHLFKTPKGRELASLLMGPGDNRPGQVE